jgi:hypothetical protein
MKPTARPPVRSFHARTASKVGRGDRAPSARARSRRGSRQGTRWSSMPPLRFALREEGGDAFVGVGGPHQVVEVEALERVERRTNCAREAPRAHARAPRSAGDAECGRRCFARPTRARPPRGRRRARRRGRCGAPPRRDACGPRQRSSATPLADTLGQQRRRDRCDHAELDLGLAQLRVGRATTRWQNATSSSPPPRHWPAHRGDDGDLARRSSEQRVEPGEHRGDRGGRCSFDARAEREVRAFRGQHDRASAWGSRQHASSRPPVRRRRRVQHAPLGASMQRDVEHDVETFGSVLMASHGGAGDVEFEPRRGDERLRKTRASASVRVTIVRMRVTPYRANRARAQQG